MVNSSGEKSIKDTLSIIRKALKEDSINNDTFNDDILILNQLVKQDGTISTINDNNIKKQEVKEMLDKKISEAFESYFEKWLDKNMPNYLEKFFSKKVK